METTTDRMIATSPQHGAFVDAKVLAECIEACAECDIACTGCADACLGEASIAKLRLCVRLNLDCADVCATTARILGRLFEPDPELLRAQVGACAAACAICASECQRHASMHEHCRICVEACDTCQDRCVAVLQRLPASA